jgi:hypothetical protein
MTGVVRRARTLMFMVFVSLLFYAILDSTE